MQSKYQLSGGGGFYLLLWIGTFAFIGLVLSQQPSFSDLPYEIIVVFILQQIILCFLASVNLKQLTLDKDGIRLTNPILTFISQYWRWDEIDYFFTVGEEYRFGTYEAVWIVKDERLIGRFTEFYYSNYDAMKNELSIKYVGEKNLNTIQQLLCRVGIKKIKN